MTARGWFVRIMLLASLLVLVNAAQATAAGAGVRARLSNAPLLRGEFVQEKRLQGFKNPLSSKGEFLLARDRGVVWNTSTPFASTLVLTRQRLLSRQADGSTQSLGGAQASPAVSTANALLMALLSGDIDTLSRQFRLKETLAADGSWRLELVPRQGALKKIFKRIELQGDQHVRSVRLEELRGDRTDINFLQLRTTPAKLSAAEAKQFD
jgi:outer membrane lipoprotein-sorting protein